MAVAYTTLEVDARLVNEGITGGSGRTVYPVYLVVKNTDGVIAAVCRATTSAAAADIAARLTATVPA